MTFFVTRRATGWQAEASFEVARRVRRLEREDRALEEILAALAPFRREVSEFAKTVIRLGPDIFATTPDPYGAAPEGERARDGFHHAYEAFHDFWLRQVRPFMLDHDEVLSRLMKSLDLTFTEVYELSIEPERGQQDPAEYLEHVRDLDLKLGRLDAAVQATLKGTAARSVS